MIMNVRENDRKKFIELANKRVNKTIRTIRLIGNLSDKSNYSYTDDQVKQIFFVLQKELDKAKKRFEKGDVKEKEEFRLS
jgi:hypothetical protein